MSELARQLVEHWAFEWVPGMLARRRTGPCSGSYRYSDGDIRAGAVYVRGVPDLEDDATKGVLLGLVRKLYPEYHVSVVEYMGGYCIATYQRGYVPVHGFDDLGLLLPGPGSCPTEGEALARAILAVSERRPG